MSDKKLLQVKLEKDVELAQIKLAELKAKIKRKATAVRVTDSIHIEVLEQRIEEAKQRLHELNKSRGSVPKQTVERVEDTWSALQDSLQDAISTFEGEQ
jgi:hypothetical protein